MARGKNLMNASQIKRAARTAARAPLNVPVAVIPGDSPPRLRGEGFSWRTPGGAPVRHPGAYSRAWGKPIYIPSSLRVEMGEEFPMAAGWTPAPVRGL